MSLLVLEVHLMTDTISGVLNTDDVENPKPGAGLDGQDEQLIHQLVRRTKAVACS